MFLAAVVYDDPLKDLLLFTISTPYSAVISCLTNVSCAESVALPASFFGEAFYSCSINTRVNTERG